MDLHDRILDGPRWIVVEPKGMLGKLGDLLEAMGLATAGSQAALMGGVLLLGFVVLRIAQRSVDRQPAGKTNAAPARSVAYAAAMATKRGARASDPAPLPYVGNGGSRGAALRNFLPRGKEKCVWRQGHAQDRSGQEIWVCATCGQSAVTEAGQGPKGCLREAQPLPA